MRTRREFIALFDGVAAWPIAAGAHWCAMSRDFDEYA